MTKYIRLFTSDYGTIKLTTYESLEAAKKAVRFGGGGNIVRAIDVEGPLE